MDEATSMPPARLEGVARGVMTALPDGRVALHPAHTDYQIHLTRATKQTIPDGKRARGVVEAKALRIHSATGGGRFIEPVTGEPRIVAGTVVAIDQSNGRILVDAVIPIWLKATENQDFGVIVEGGLVNCHVESGATFRPTAGDGG